MAQAVEELLRFTSPTQYMTRTTTRDVEVRGTVIPANSKVALLLGSGNRDPREFERPDDFDIFRPNPRILAFGHGAHVCLGAAVARLESRIALQEFLARVPRVRGRRVRRHLHAFGQRAGPDAHAARRLRLTGGRGDRRGSLR